MSERWSFIEGDARAVLPTCMKTGSFALAYLDPPYGTQLDWAGTAGEFSDKFTWSDDHDAALSRLGSIAPHLPPLLRALPCPSSHAAYLVEMAVLINATRDALADRGIIFLQCDDTSRAYLRLLLDLIFGPTRQLGEIVWRRAGAHSNAKTFGRVHDTILVAQKRCHLRYARRYRRPYDEVLVDMGAGDLESLRDDRGHYRGIVNGVSLNPSSNERVGWPTQKPLALIELLIRSASFEDDWVLDPVCGSGTTVVAALGLGRRAVGIDREAKAVALARARCQELAREGVQLELL